MDLLSSALDFLLVSAYFAGILFSAFVLFLCILGLTKAYDLDPTQLRDIASLRENTFINRLRVRVAAIVAHKYYDRSDLNEDDSFNEVAFEKYKKQTVLYTFAVCSLVFLILNKLNLIDNTLFGFLNMAVPTLSIVCTAAALECYKKWMKEDTNAFLTTFLV